MRFRNGFRNRNKIKWEEFDLKKIMNLPDTLTFLNLISGVGSIYFSIEGKFGWAMSMLIIASIMDYMDGKVAELQNRKTEFGKQIDSLSDIVSFGVAPAVFGYLFYKASLVPNVFLLGGILFFMVCGLIRLARYNVINYSKKFIGMPITVNGLFFPLYYIIYPNPYLLPPIFLISGVLMISSFKVRRIL